MINMKTQKQIEAKITELENQLIQMYGVFSKSTPSPLRDKIIVLEWVLQ